MTPHIDAKMEDIESTVIMPGDPLRAKFIADNYLEKARLVNDVRGMLAYTGYYKNKRVTVMASGMGMPSMGIYSYELYHFYKVSNIIRIGSCGSYTKDLDLYDLVLVTDAYSDSSFASVQNGSTDKIIAADVTINEQIEKVASINNIKLNKGRIYSSDVFYTEKDNHEALFKEQKCLGTEMESFALFHNAKLLNKKAACLLTVSDNFVTNKKVTPYERQTAFTKMIELVLESLV